MVSLPQGNRLLDGLPPDEAVVVRPLLRVVDVARGETTTVEGTPMATVDFPLTALMTVTGSLRDGTLCEVASVGTDGFVEVDAALESSVALRTAMCQFDGAVARMPIAAFQDSLRECSAFAVGVRRAVRARMFVSEQTQICNLRHRIEQRLARWLLVAQDRLRRPHLSITHDFMAAVLGVRRAGVSDAVARLEEAGALRHSRALLEISDIAALETFTCECYALCRDAIDEALGADRADGGSMAARDSSAATRAD